MAVSAGTRRVQKHKRTQDRRAGPFRSSSPRGEPQIWGVSEAMSAIRVPRTWQGNTVQKRDATLPGRRPGSRSWAKMDIKEARAAPGPERASPLRRGIPGFWTSRVASFPTLHGPVSGPLLPLAQTWHSKIEIRDENRK